MAYTGLGVSFTDIAKGVSTAVEYGDVVVNVLEDPAFPEVKRQLQKLRQLEVAKGARAGKAEAQVKGIGLVDAVVPLKAFVWYRSNKLIALAAIAGVLAIPYLVGRGSRR